MSKKEKKIREKIKRLESRIESKDDKITLLMCDIEELEHQVIELEEKLGEIVLYE